MSRFPLPLLLEAFSPESLKELGADRALYKLNGDFVYQSPAFGTVTVPAGYVTDFASIPRIAWVYLSPEDPVVMFASIIHDYMYTRQGDLGRGDNLTFSRKSCDTIIREAMEYCGARRSQAAFVYWAVRIGGRSHWKS